MKLSKISIDKIAKTMSNSLLCSVGLKDAKKIAAQIKRNLLAEDERRRDL